GCAIVSDCNLIDTTPDDAVSTDIWDRPFAGGTCCSTLGPVSYDVYGPFTVDATGLYDILNVQVGGWDGYLFVYENCFDPLDQLNGFVAGDDDGAGGIGTSDIIDVMLTTGTDYYVITTGFSAGDFGDFETTITGVGTASCGAAPVDNDLCIDAIAMACGDTATGDTSDNTDTGGNAAPDEWYSFTGTGTPEFVTFSLCDGGTGYDSLLRVFDACGGTEIAGNDDACGLQSEVTFTSDGTSTYYIMIEGFASSAGVYSLEVSCMLIPPPPANDECTGAIDITCGDALDGTTIDATLDDSVVGDCGDATLTSAGVWYVFNDTSGLASNVNVSTCGGITDYDTKISVFTGDCGAPPLTCVDGNDDSPDCTDFQSEVDFVSDGNTTYYILVHGFGGATGDFTLTMTCDLIPPPNDDIANSITVVDCPFTDSGVAMPAATTEGGNPVGCNIDGANGVWYNITPAGDGTITATIDNPSGLSHVTFYTAADENASEADLTLVDHFDNQCLPGTTTTIDVVTDQVYYVFVVNTGGITDISFDCDLLAIADNVIEGFSFYPNPSSDVINIDSQDLIENVSIYNILGQKVIDQNIDATSSQINVANLAQGTYIMKATVNGVTASYKVIKK
ncbi:MAG: T9SS type A sorting domain-containing protein, partial [Flavobacteriaceae bacterium]|nr:T9SS type A sorting domain-containing protein [Flavobacteriaceae bacterium]